MKAQSQASLKTMRRFRGRLSRTILLTLLPLLLIPVLVAGSGAFFGVYTLTRNQITQQLANSVETEASQIAVRTQAKEAFLARLTTQDAFITPLSSLLDMPLASPMFYSTHEAVIKGFQAAVLAESDPGFDTFLVTNSSGTVVISSNHSWEGLSITGSQLETLVDQRKSLAIYRSAPLYDNRFLIVSSFPYTNNNGIQATIFGLRESTEPLLYLQAGKAVHPQAQAYYYTRDGFFLAEDAQSQALAPIQPSDQQKASLFPLMSSSAVAGQRQFVASNGQAVMAYAKWLPELEAGLIVQIPQEVVTTPLKNLGILIFGLVAGTMLFLAVVIWLGTRNLVKPISMLSETTRGFAEGEWQQRAAVDRDDEIGLLAYSFNQMAEELTNLYRSLESKVEARTKQIRMAAEVAQMASSAPNLRELLRRTVTLIGERFGYYDASIFLIDDTRTKAILTESIRRSAEPGASRDLRLPVGGDSIIGWVTTNNQPRVVSNVLEDPLYLKDDLHPDTRSEVVVPISVGSFLLGVLDVQSVEVNAFGQDEVVVLQTLANQIASAIQNARLLEATQVNLEETWLLSNTSRQVAQASSKNESVQVVAKALRQTSYLSAAYLVDENGLWPVPLSDLPNAEKPTSYERLPITPEELEKLLPPGQPFIIADPKKSPNLPEALLKGLRNWQANSLAFIPVRPNGALAVLFILGSTEKSVFTSTSLQPYANLSELLSTVLEKIQTQKDMELRINELQTLNKISQTIATQTEAGRIYPAVHEALRQTMGPVNFLVALYDSPTNQIQIPYLFNGLKVSKVDPYPMGEGLISIVIKSRQSLLLEKVDEDALSKLGAKMLGAPAKSWLGVPLIIAGEAVGAIVVQDLEREERFTENDLRLLSTLAGQVAVSIHSANLLEMTSQRAENERLLYELTSKIRSSMNIQGILQTTAVELGKALGARRAQIEIGVEQAPEPVTPNPNGHENGEETR